MSSSARSLCLSHSVPLHVLILLNKCLPLLAMNFSSKNCVFFKSFLLWNLIQCLGHKTSFTYIIVEGCGIKDTWEEIYSNDIAKVERQTRFRKKIKDSFLHGLWITGWLCPLKRNERAWKIHQQFRQVRLSRVLGGKVKWKKSFWKTGRLCLILKRLSVTLRMIFEFLNLLTWTCVKWCLPISWASSTPPPFIPCVSNPVIFWLFVEYPQLILTSGLYMSNSILTFKLSLPPEVMMICEMSLHPQALSRTFKVHWSLNCYYLFFLLVFLSSQHWKLMVNESRYLIFSLLTSQCCLILSDE